MAEPREKKIKASTESINKRPAQRQCQGQLLPTAPATRPITASLSLSDSLGALWLWHRE